VVEPFRQFPPQMPGVAAWVNGGLLRFQGLNGLDGFRRGAQGVFVVVKTINFRTAEHLAQNIVRFAGNIGFDFLDMPGNQNVQRRKRMHHRDSSSRCANTRRSPCPPQGTIQHGLKPFMARAGLSAACSGTPVSRVNSSSRNPSRRRAWIC